MKLCLPHFQKKGLCCVGLYGKNVIDETGRCRAVSGAPMSAHLRDRKSARAADDVREDGPDNFPRKAAEVACDFVAHCSLRLHRLGTPISSVSVRQQRHLNRVYPLIFETKSGMV